MEVCEYISVGMLSISSLSTGGGFFLFATSSMIYF